MEYEDQIDLLQQELQSNNIGQHVSIIDLQTHRCVLPSNHSSPNFSTLEPNARKSNELVIEVLLKWARVLREAAVTGDATLHELEVIAETSEFLAVNRINTMTLHGGHLPEFKSLVDSIPDRDLRKESRRVSLVAAWRAHESTSWLKRTGDTTVVRSRTFPYQGPLVAHQVSWLSLERTRADRFIDKMVELVLDQLKHGLPATSSSAGFVERGKLRFETMAPNEEVGNVGFGQHWTEDYERQIERLRKSYASIKAE